VLFEPFCFDRRGEVPPGKKGSILALLRSPGAPGDRSDLKPKVDGACLVAREIAASVN
jgi:hypothetical protein